MRLVLIFSVCVFLMVVILKIFFVGMEWVFFLRRFVERFEVFILRNIFIMLMGFGELLFMVMFILV